MGRAIAPESALLAKFFVRGETAYRLARRKNPRAKLLLHHNFVKGIFRPSERALGTWIMLLTILVLLVALAVGADAATVSVRTTGLVKAAGRFHTETIFCNSREPRYIKCKLKLNT